LKLKELASELGIDSKKLKEELNEELGLGLKKITDKLPDEVVDLIKDRYKKAQDVKEVQVEEKGIKAFDFYHSLGITLSELEEKLKEVGFSKEITNWTIIDEETVEKVKKVIEDEKKRKEEELRKLEEERKRREEEQKAKKEEELKVKEGIKEIPEEKKEEEIKLEPKIEEIPEVIEGVVAEEERRSFRKEKREFEKKEERKPFEKKSSEKKPFEKKPYEKREKYEKKGRFEKREETRSPKEGFAEKEKYKEERKPFEKRERFEKREEKQPTPIAIVPESIKEEKRVEKKETKEERETRLAKEQKEEMEALRKLMEGQPKKKKPKKEEKKKEVEEQSKEEEIKIVQIPEVITVRELADLLDIPVNQILMDLLKRKILATVNQTIDPKIAIEIAEEHGFLAELKEEGTEEEKEAEEEILSEEETAEEEGNLVPRPPVVVVMGHVDHGKTTLLDTIRKTDVAAKEHGGITQHIGAYKIKLSNGKEITFLDTPGHEAFTTLRARGSKVADIAILVVAADDGVKPQTVEAINHAKSAKVPIVVAVNKIDKPGADPMRVRQELTQYGLIPEEWGGDTIFVDVSAKTGKNIEELLEMVLLVAEMLELKANPNRPAVGTVIESKLDPKKGPVATVLVENGTLKVGDYFVAGYTWGKVKALLNDRGERLKEAGPGTPVEVLGFEEVPHAGDKFIVKASEREAKQLAEIRKLRREEELLAKKTRIHLENLSEVKEVNIIIKADTQGSLEALRKSIEELSNKFSEVSINIMHGAVGGITESDVMLAAASNAIIIGFNVRPDAGARKAAEEENVDIRVYNIIYQALEDLEKAMKGMLAPTYREVLLGTAEVRATFKAKSIGTIAGCYITDGVIKRNAKARLVRNGVVIYDGEISSLKRFKEDVKEVQKGFECGLTLKNFNDIKVGDIIEAYEIVEERPQ
jgi:translation initiation factor IF-2